MSNKTILACSHCGTRNYSTVSKKQEQRLEVKKYCKQCNAHTVHKETR
ncbi:50S ribosomal protein L33 [Bacillus spongiae]|uniref:Large ribosomal subunit protein bL33 n=1 Tax=Bacillus spongiae TaxID=2683610 RepID=A0ABU8HJ40_9BACI